MFELVSFNSILNEAARQQANFEAYMEECGLKAKTTFFSDFAIADMAQRYGEDREAAIRDTFQRATQEWIGDVEMFTELVMVLNLRGWTWYNKGDEFMSQLYFDLYHQADDMATEHFEGADLEYYYQTID